MEADTFAQQRLARKHSTRSSPDAASRPQQRASVTAAAAAGSSEVTSLAAAVQSLDGDNPFYEYAMIVPSSRKASKLLQRRIGACGAATAPVAVRCGLRNDATAPSAVRCGLRTHTRGSAPRRTLTSPSHQASSMKPASRPASSRP